MAGPMPRPAHARSGFLKITCSRSWASCRDRGVNSPYGCDECSCRALVSGCPRSWSSLMSSLRRALGIAALAVAAGVGLGPGVTAAPISVHEVYPVPPNGVFTLDGHGYGHGHGMSQFGAYGAAQKGLTAAQIVAFFYPTTSLGTTNRPSVRVLIHDAAGAPLTIEPRRQIATTVASS